MHQEIRLRSNRSPATGTYYLYAAGSPELLFTENESNRLRLYDQANHCPYVKDAFHRYLIDGQVSAVNPAREGTKAAALYRATLAPGESRGFKLRLSRREQSRPFEEFDACFRQREAEADEFYNAVQKPGLNDDERQIQRQAAGRYALDQAVFVLQYRTMAER